MQVVEPDTAYLMDLDVESLLSVWEGGMMAADEVTGGAPPWRGGDAAEVVAGKYRDGLRADDSTVLLPGTGLLGADQWTLEFFVSSLLPWASLSSAVAFTYWNGYTQLIDVTLTASTIVVTYKHDNDAVFVHRAAVATGQNHAADTFVSIATAVLAGTMRLYINGVLADTETGCTPPRAWDDNWNAPYGGMTISGNANLTVSDLRISRLARVPGEVPAP